jgi:hypothetical protein
MVRPRWKLEAKSSCNALLTINNIKVYFAYHKIHIFQVYKPMTFSNFTEQCNYLQNYFRTFSYDSLVLFTVDPHSYLLQPQVTTSQSAFCLDISALVGASHSSHHIVSGIFNLAWHFRCSPVRQREWEMDRPHSVSPFMVTGICRSVLF